MVILLTLIIIGDNLASCIYTMVNILWYTACGLILVLNLAAKL
jgi:hypothetical protein